MSKIITISLFLCTILNAQNFEIILQKAIKNSPYLYAQNSSIKEAKEEASLMLRYENPTLNVEYSRFMPSAGNDSQGYAIGYTQPLRLWDVGSAKESFANASIKNANATYKEKKATFIKESSLAYTLYCRDKMLQELSQEELLIAKKIYDISDTNYENGTIAKSTMLQAQASYKKIEIGLKNLELNFKQSYYNLLQAFGINEEIDIDTEYDFTISQNISLNPTIAILESDKNMAMLEANIYKNSIEYIDVYAKVEKESTDNITRVGLNIPLAFFNTRKEQKQLALIKADKTQHLLMQENNFVDVELLKLKNEALYLQKLKQSNLEMLKIEEELLRMFEDGYEISNINLLELQDIKNRVIATKKALIDIRVALNQNAIKQNYLQGNYNE